MEQITNTDLFASQLQLQWLSTRLVCYWSTSLEGANAWLAETHHCMYEMDILTIMLPIRLRGLGIKQLLPSGHLWFISSLCTYCPPPHPQHCKAEQIRWSDNVLYFNIQQKKTKKQKWSQLIALFCSRSSSSLTYLRVTHQGMDLKEIKGQTDIWKGRRGLAIIYFGFPHTPDGCHL